MNKYLSFLVAGLLLFAPSFADAATACVDRTTWPAVRDAQVWGPYIYSDVHGITAVAACIDEWTETQTYCTRNSSAIWGQGINGCPASDRGTRPVRRGMRYCDGNNPNTAAGRQSCTAAAVGGSAVGTRFLAGRHCWCQLRAFRGLAIRSSNWHPAPGAHAGYNDTANQRYSSVDTCIHYCAQACRNWMNSSIPSGQLHPLMQFYMPADRNPGPAITFWGQQ
jgi:hypothetical protein